MGGFKGEKLRSSDVVNVVHSQTPVSAVQVPLLDTCLHL